VPGEGELSSRRGREKINIRKDERTASSTNSYASELEGDREESSLQKAPYPNGGLEERKLIEDWDTCLSGMDLP